MFGRLFGGGLAVLWLDYWALVWVGMRVGLKAPTFPRAVVGTLGRVMGLPWLAVFFVIFLSTTLRTAGASTEISLFTAWFALGILNDISVGGRARREIQREFEPGGQRPWLLKPVGELMAPQVGV
jgi:hypothetical protein